MALDTNPTFDNFMRDLILEDTVKLGGSDKMQNLDMGPTHKTGGAKHKINDFCFLKFFISMKFYPSQAQKTIFSQFPKSKFCILSDPPS